MEVPSSAGLRQLFQRSFPFVEVMAEGEGADRYDCSTYHLSLPLYCASTPELWPAPPYLRSAPQSVKSWHTRLRRSPGVKVGIIWRTGAESWNSAQRSCPLSNLLPLTALSGVQLFALQQDVSDQEKATLGQLGIVDLSDKLQTWDDTAKSYSSEDAPSHLPDPTAAASLTKMRGKASELSPISLWQLLPNTFAQAFTSIIACQLLCLHQSAFLPAFLSLHDHSSR